MSETPLRDNDVSPPANWSRSARVGAQALGALALAELAHHFALDLADPLAGETETLADLVQRARLAVFQAVAQPDHGLLALVQRGQHPAQVVLQQAGDDRALRIGRLAVLDEVTERSVLLRADRHVQAHRVARVVEQVGD